MQTPNQFGMRQFSPDPPAGTASPAEAWRPFDYRLRRCLADLGRGGCVGGRAGFMAAPVAWIGWLHFIPDAAAGWAAGLAWISLIGGLIGGMTGAALGLALADEE